MNRSELTREIVATYKKHGWQPRRALLRPETLRAVESTLREIEVKEALFDAIWFSRPSFNKREAWELRLLEESPYALFETFAESVSSEEREALMKEMEERMGERSSKGPNTNQLGPS